MRSSTSPRRLVLLPSLVLAALVALAGLAGPRAAAAAPATPSATLTLQASPQPVAPGAAVTLTGTLTNTGARTETFTVAYQITGPCAVSDAYTLSVRLRAGESQTASATRLAPGCPGVYTVTATATVGGVEVATAQTTITVQTSPTAP